MIMRSLPLEGHAHFLGKNIVYFETLIDSGIERTQKEFKKGDIAFLPASGSICLYVADTVSEKTMSLIGKTLENIDVLKEVKSGDVLSLYEEAD